MSRELTRTPRETAERLLEVVQHGSPDDLADLYAEDSVIDIPFGREPGKPLRFEGREGPDGHRTRFRTFLPMTTITGVDLVALHETADPEVVIAEYDYHATAVPTGRSFTQNNVMVMRVRDGLIVHSRDYSNPLATAAAFAQ